MADVVYNFVPENVDAVKRAFQGTAEAAIKAAERQKRAIIDAEQAGTDAAIKQLTNKLRRSTYTADRLRALGLEELRDTRKKIEQQEKLERQASEKRIREQAKEARAQIREAEKVARKLKSLDRIQSVEKARKERREAVEARAKARIEKRNTKALADYQRRQNREELKKQSALSKAAARSITSVTNQAVGIGDALSTVVGGTGLGLATAGIALAGGAVRSSLRLRSSANRIAINARGAGGESVDPAVLRKEFENVAVATPGLEASDVASLVETFAKTRGGDPAKAVAEARKYAGTLATFQSATGTSSEEAATTAADLVKRFDVTSINDLQEALGKLVAFAKQSGGSIEEATARLDKNGAVAKRFGLGSGAVGLGNVFALEQLARQGAGKEEAPEATKQFLTKITEIKSAKALQAKGVNVFKGKTGELNPIEETIAAIFSKIGPANNDTEKGAQIVQAVGGQESYRAIAPLYDRYKTTYQATKGTQAEKTKAASEAVIKAFRDVSTAAGSWSNVQQDAALAQRDTGAQLTAVWERLKSQVSDSLEPTLVELVGGLSNNKAAIEAFASAVALAGKGLEAFFAALQRLGVVGGGTPQEKAAQSIATSARLGTELESLGDYDKLTPEGQRRYNELYSKKLIEEARGELATTAASAESTPVTDDTKTKFYERYKAAAPGASLTGSSIVAGSLASALTKTGAGYQVARDVALGVLGENDAQREERNQYQRRTGPYAPEQGSEAAKAIEEAGRKFEASVARASAEFRNSKQASAQPSITGGTR